MKISKINLVSHETNCQIIEFFNLLIVFVIYGKITGVCNICQINLQTCILVRHGSSRFIQDVHVDFKYSLRQFTDRQAPWSKIPGARNIGQVKDNLILQISLDTT